MNLIPSAETTSRQRRPVRSARLVAAGFRCGDCGSGRSDIPGFLRLENGRGNERFVRFAETELHSTNRQPMSPGVPLHNLVEVDGPGCVWPQCRMRATEKAHFHSKGMGGTPDGRRDSIKNQGGMCWHHARMSDGLQPDGWPDFVQQHTALLGEGWEARIPMNRWGFERAEALTRLVARRRAKEGSCAGLS